MDIAIWGAGKFGQFVIRQLINKPNIQIRCVIDRRADELDGILELPVVTPMKFKETFLCDVDVVLVAFMNGMTVKEELKGVGVEKIGIISDLAYTYGIALKDNIWEDRQIIWIKNLQGDLPFLPTLETNVVDYCNLNCKGCSHFSNLFPGGSRVAFKDFRKDIRYLAEKINLIQFNLLGGEVFLSDELEEYIACLAEYMPMTRVQLVTNGILIPKQSPERMHFLAQNNVYVSITEYPPVTQMKKKIGEILNSYGIHYQMRQAVTTFGKNIDVSGGNDPWEAQRTCRESRCHFLREGRIYKCPFSALGNYFFKHYDIPLHFEEGIDIYNEENDWKTIIDNLEGKPVAQCKFCGVEERFPWAVSIHPTKEEWMI